MNNFTHINRLTLHQDNGKIWAWKRQMSCQKFVLNSLGHQWPLVVKGLKSRASLIVLLLAWINHLPATAFPNKVVANVPNNMLGNPTFCFFASFSIVLPTHFTNKPDPLRDLTILSEIINLVVPGLWMTFEYLHLLLT